MDVQAAEADRLNRYEGEGSASMATKSLGFVQLLDLSRQQRNLLLMRPVFELEARKNQYESSDGERRLFEGIDTHYLVLSLLDDLMEAVAVDAGRTTKEVICHLSQVALAMRPESCEEDCIRIAEIVLDAIANRSDKHREFEYEFFDAPSKSMRSYRFKLIEYVPDIADVFRFVPTREGYLVYLGMLDLSPEDAAELMEKMLQLLIERGRFSDAIDIAKKARTISIEFSQKIRDMILRARRAPSTVNWKIDIEPRLSDARGHVRRRQIEDARMVESVQSSLNSSFEREVRQHLINLKSLLNGAGKVRTRLLQDVMCADEQFLEAQRALFKVKTSSNLPDLENLMLPEIFSLPVDDLAGMAEPVISAFMPPRVSRVFDLNTAVMVLLEKREVELVAELDDGEIVAFEDLKAWYSDEERQIASDWLADKLAVVSSTTSEALLRAAAGDGLSHEVCQCIALFLYQSFADDSPMKGFDISVNGKRICLQFAYGSNMTLKRRQELDYEYQS